MHYELSGLIFISCLSSVDTYRIVTFVSTCIIFAALEIFFNKKICPGLFEWENFSFLKIYHLHVSVIIFYYGVNVAPQAIIDDW